MTSKNGKRWWVGALSTAAGSLATALIVGGYLTVMTVAETLVLAKSIDARLTRVEVWIYNRTDTP